MTILMMLFVNITIAQNSMPDFPIDTGTKKITYSEVIRLDTSISKTELYSAAKEWFAKTYKSATDVIQYAEKDEGKIVGRALFKVNFKTIFGTDYPGGHINYTISIYTKDGRYKYEITDFYHVGMLTESGRIPDGGPCEDLIHETKGFMGNSYKKTYLLFLIQLDENMKALIDSLKKEMTERRLDEKSDW